MRGRFGNVWQRHSGNRYAVGRRRDVRLGRGRFIADSWFSDEPLPPAYTTQPRRGFANRAASRPSRPTGRRSKPYLERVDILGAIAGFRAEDRKPQRLRGSYLAGLALCSKPCGTSPWRFWAGASRSRTTAACRHPPARRRNRPILRPNGNAWPSCWPGPGTLRMTASRCWRRWMPGEERTVPMASIEPLGAAVIAWFDH